MDWIKIQVTLPRCPKVVKLAKLMGVSRHEALGMAVEWFAWLDGVTEDGRTGLTAAEIEGVFCCNARSVTDGNAGVYTFCDALCEIGWAEVDENGEIYAVNYETHNGKSAKKRAQTAERVRNMRKKKSNASSVTNVTQKALPEKRREDIYNKEIPNESYTTVCGEKNEPAGRTCRPLPEGAAEVQRFMAAQAVCGLKGEELEACARGFFDDMEACGWTARNGAPLYDWQAAARKYVASWQRNALRRQGGTPTVYRSEQPKNYNL